MHLCYSIRTPQAETDPNSSWSYKQILSRETGRDKVTTLLKLVLLNIF